MDVGALSSKSRHLLVSCRARWPVEHAEVQAKFLPKMAGNCPMADWKKSKKLWRSRYLQQSILELTSSSIVRETNLLAIISGISISRSMSLIPDSTKEKAIVSIPKPISVYSTWYYDEKSQLTTRKESSKSKYPKAPKSVIWSRLRGSDLVAVASSLRGGIYMWYPRSTYQKN